MFRIGICDDDSKVRDELKRIVEQVMFHQKVEYEVVQFQAGEELCEKLDAEDFSQINLLFLDIEMPGMDGLEVKERLSKNEKVKRIVFVSSHTESVMEAFGLKTVGFVSKPIDHISIQNKLEMVLEEHVERKMLDLGSVGSNNGSGVIAVQDILYLEADGNYTQVYTKNEKTGIIESKMVSVKLGDIEKKNASVGLIRVHKSYMVNFDYVKNVSDYVAFMECSSMVPVGRKYKVEVHDLYMDYLLQKSRRMM